MKFHEAETAGIMVEYEFDDMSELLLKPMEICALASMQANVLALLATVIFPALQNAIPAAIAGLGMGEIVLILVSLVTILVRIAIPVAVIFLLYQWWKNREKK